MEKRPNLTEAQAFDRRLAEIRTELEHLNRALKTCRAQECERIAARAGALREEIVAIQARACARAQELLRADPWLLDVAQTPSGPEAFSAACQARIAELKA